MNSIPSAPYPSPSRDTFPMSQLGVPQPGMPQPGMPQPGKPQPGMPQPGMPQAGVPSYGISVPQSGASQDGWSSLNMICPPGLEYLIALDYLSIRQQEEPIELISGFECENKYHVTTANDQRLCYIQEESNMCALLCLGPSRCCEFRVVDTSERAILYMVLEVYSRGLLLGTVIEHRSSFLRPLLSIRDASEKTVLRVKGPWIKCCGTAKFKIMSADDVHTVGEIKKEWGGCCTEAFTDADNFSLRFPIDLDVKIKAVLLGACILIDYLYFEESKCGILRCLEVFVRACGTTIELITCLAA
ncbi:Phospholipid scramblase 1 [Melipona quadrifasciata]|uniref:Phospholipid scramblase n=1 Tax=Melipona quadrifasciata TaxID=166423 RepID=A0A0N0U7K3_9HYME|nr:Phospholipid scramblase 1 [Melipona quadrifasciata]